ncbi:MAG: 1-acyl-sn-glycerol-3-phosphate acyltransferase [Saprospiraceae bacterium]|nr:1-acyl-sn-glycerol-3-phosphate acyltransferase [Saprospiraceae bacterium]
MNFRNRTISPPLRFIYFLLRAWSWVGTSVYYRKVTRLGLDNLRFDGPVIVVSNHPSTLLDPLNVGISIRQEMFFLANYGLFKNPVLGWILSRLYCIPIKRREDVQDGEARNNDNAFRQSFEHLEQYGLLFIAAEGGSWDHPFVRPFKTGTARIAFGTEKRNQWAANVRILPVGLSYAQPQTFRDAEVVIHYGELMPVSAWQAQEEQDHEAAVDAFTQAIEQRVRDLCIDGKREENDEYVKTWSSIFKHNAPDEPKVSYALTKEFCLKHADNTAVKTETDQYVSALNSANLTDQGIAEAQKAPSPWRGLLLVLMSPLAAAGFAIWVLPFQITLRIVNALKLYSGYNSAAKFLVGTFAIVITLLTAGWLAGRGLTGLLTMIAMILAGFAADVWWVNFQRWNERRKARTHDALNTLTQMRQQLLNS